MKTLLFVPGFQEDRGSRDYDSVLQAFESCGFKTVFVDINWHRTTQADWVRQLNKVYDTYDAQEVFLAGFSFGAVTVFLAAAERSPAGLVLCSLSPMFEDDIERWSAIDHKIVGSRRELEARGSIFLELAEKISSPVWSFYGEQELARWPDMRHRSTELKRAFPAGVHTVIPGVGHEVEHSQYRAALCYTRNI